MRRKILFFAPTLLAAAGIALFLLPSDKGKGGFDQEQLVEDMEELRSFYLENQALFQEVTATFDGDDRIKDISPSLDDKGEFDLWIGNEAVPLSETYPELYASISTLCSEGFPFLSFSRQEEGAVRCYVTFNRYDIAPHGPTGTGIFLYFCEKEPEQTGDLDFCQFFSDGCWGLAETNPLE